jgi:hypothetical protein
MRFPLRLKGAQVDHDKGIEGLAKTAAHGHYLEPLARLQLAVAALRDNNPNEGARLLRELYDRFPHNPRYTSWNSTELSREFSAARTLAQHDWQEETEA